MKKSQITLIIIGFILLALMATNPSIEDHRQAVMNEIKKKMSQESNPDNKWEQVGQAIGMAFGQGIIEKAVTRDNYLIFSITKISFNDKPKYFGIGILGHVFTNDYEKIKNSGSESENWTGKYEYGDQILNIADDRSCIIEAAGIQVYFKILCTSRVKDGNFEIYYSKTLDGNYLPSDWIDKEKPILTLFYIGNDLYTDEGQLDIQKNGVRMLFHKIK